MAPSWASAAAAAGSKDLVDGLPIAASTRGIGGTAAYLRVYDARGNAHIQATIALFGDDTADLAMNDTGVIPGQAVSIDKWTFVSPSPNVIVAISGTINNRQNLKQWASGWAFGTSSAVAQNPDKLARVTKRGSYIKTRNDKTNNDTE
jgi:hypothetical protein